MNLYIVVPFYGFHYPSDHLIGRSDTPDNKLWLFVVAACWPLPSPRLVL